MACKHIKVKGYKVGGHRVKPHTRKVCGGRKRK